MFAPQPRHCAACGRLNMVTANSPYGGEVCDATCQQVLRIRQARSSMGEAFDENKDLQTWADAMSVRAPTQP